MQPFLIFGLTANLGAMGELAGHERRGGLTFPGRSAVIGVMGAALGIRRDGDFSALEVLEITIGLHDSGAPLRDYHTIETVPSAAVKSPNSRPEALRAARGRTNTTITLRDYRAGPLFSVAVAGQGLAALATALNAPVFTLYLGRKSCPLAAPPGARLVQAERAEDALAQLILPPWRQKDQLQAVVVEDPAGEVLHDRALDRARWHFAARRVAVRPVAGAAT
ncbi:type I-E CRISPR-associated protein Cas5/CasD [Fuscovulum blasticum]|uniref:type I-E CRISPR-associated protein Cas5/CasD n=1 Tax=Fuscovulum blasticum TaxID=1075 RepID=UPI000D3ED3CB|nr:type I-E CRISPR-associated protein Cas5/CasD [Fuscovulum blasticum]AWD23009.1 type I-E CRISPR-associated protein Cas5/CasD [Fuscovulum blasticum]